jgi:NAD(P)-dependent dehydrogenase (short-subunit alcohol dehydrogenase family)
VNNSRVAVVTGAAAGIGRSIAHHLGKDGFAIAAIDIDEQELETTTRLGRDQGTSIEPYPFDLCKVRDIPALIERVEQAQGEIEILVNNAAIVKTQLMMEVSESDWDSMMTVNAKSLFFCLQAAARRMLLRQRGVIINVASVAARSARPKQTVYGASKAAVLHLTKSAAAALGPQGIRVNTICPGVIEAPMWHTIKEERTPQEVQRILESIPLGRSAQPEEIAEIVSFLASDRSGYINGQAINVCGGLEMD